MTARSSSKPALNIAVRLFPTCASYSPTSDPPTGRNSKWGCVGMRTVTQGARCAVMSMVFLCCCLLAATSRAEEPTLRQFDIGVQNLSAALNEFARQSQQQILFAPDVVAQKISTAVRGNMPPLTALKLLLKDSGLKFTTTP